MCEYTLAKKKLDNSQAYWAKTLNNYNPFFSLWKITVINKCILPDILIFHLIFIKLIHIYGLQNSKTIWFVTTEMAKSQLFVPLPSLIPTPGRKTLSLSSFYQWTCASPSWAPKTSWIFKNHPFGITPIWGWNSQASFPTFFTTDIRMTLSTVVLPSWKPVQWANLGLFFIQQMYSVVLARLCNRRGMLKNKLITYCV